MKVAVLPYECATMCTVYLRICIQSARFTSVLNLVPISFWPAAATSWWNTSTSTPCSSSASAIAFRMSCSVSIGGTGKWPPLTGARCAMLPFSYSSPDDHGASSDLILTKQPDMSAPQVTESKMKNSGSGPKYAVSPMPVDLRYASARLASERGSRSYPLPSIGSITSQVMFSVVSSVNGSILAESASGESSMSEASIPFQPAIEEPSNA